jgi:hypothetical protein
MGMSGPANAGAVAVVGLGILLSFAGLLLLFTAWVMFMLFLRSLSLYLDDESTADEVQQALILGIVIGVAPPGLIVFLAIMLRNAPAIAVGAIMFIVVIGWLVAWLKVLFTILNIIGTIRQKLAVKY